MHIRAYLYLYYLLIYLRLHCLNKLFNHWIRNAFTHNPPSLLQLLIITILYCLNKLLFNKKCNHLLPQLLNRLVHIFLNKPNVHSFNYWFIHYLNYSFIQYLIKKFIHSFVTSITQSLDTYVPQ